MRQLFITFCFTIFSIILFAQQDQAAQPLSPDLPFTYVKIDESTPEWAKLLYGDNPNIREVNKLYHIWKLNNPNVKNGHTRNYKHFLAYLIQEDGINGEGYVVLPTDGLARTKAWERKRKSLKRNSRSSGNAWTVVGPTFVPETQGRVNAQSNVYAIDQSKSSPDILYMGTETGAVFKSEDKGESWFSVSDDYTFGGSMELEIHPTNPDVVYLGTTNDIMKTVNGGITWNSVRYNYRQRMSTIIIDPSDPEVVIAGGVEGMYRTINGGTTWTEITSTSVFDLKFKSDDPEIVFAILDNSNDKVSDFYRSIDNGVNWTKVSEGWDEPDASSNNRGGRMTTSDIHSGVIYTFTGARYLHLDDPKNGIKIRKSSDAGLTWTLLVDSEQRFKRAADGKTSVMNNGQGYYDWDIEMMDADTNIVVVGTQGKWLTTNGFSNDSLETWGPKIGGHSDLQEVLFNGSDYWVATDGGLVKCAPDLLSYDIKMKGVNSAEFWSFDQGWNRDAQVGTLYHNGTIGSTDTYGTGIFRFFGGAEPEFSALKHPTPDKIISKGYGSVNGRSMPDNFADKELSFKYNLQPNSNIARWLTNEESEIEVSPHNYNIHWAGLENKLMKSIDFGLTWVEVFIGRTGGTITKIEIPKANADVIYVGEYYSTGYTIYKSIDGGLTFVMLMNLPSIAGNDDDGVFMSCDHSNENVLFIGFRENDNDNDKVWKTIDGGASWININDGSNLLDGESMTDLLAITGTDGDLYVTTDHGVFHKSNTTPWIACLDGLPSNLRIRHIKPFYKESKIRIATMNRGVYSMDMINEPSNIEVQPTVSVTDGICSRDTFYFDDYSTLNHDDASWSWSFNPPVSYISDANVRNPKVLFPTNGTYQAILSITKDGNTFIDSLDKPIIMNSQCDPDNYAGGCYRMQESGQYGETFDVGRVEEEWTVSFWVKPKTNNNSTATMFDILNASGQRMFCANFLGGTMNPTMHYSGASGNAYNRNPGMTLNADEWNHLAYTSSVITGKVTIYVNGRSFVYPNVNAVPIAFDRMLIGTHSGWGTRWYEGDLDELAIYNKVLSQDEIRLRMHLTKDLIHDTGLIHYYQWNEGSNIASYDKVNLSHLSLRGSVETSDGPYSAGSSSKKFINSSGLKQFSSEGVEMTFPQNGTYPDGEIVVTRLDTFPNNAPSEDEGSSKYWVIHNFGRHQTFSPLSDITFEGYGVLSSTEASNPSEFELFTREFGQDGNTWGLNIDQAIAVSASPVNEITFETSNITSFGQFHITKGSCISSPLVMNSLDSGPGSLRQALLDACPSDTIHFDFSTNNSALMLNSIQLDVDKNVYLVGNGPTKSMLDGGGSMNIFRIMDPNTNFEIQNITFQNAFSAENGGAISNEGKLTLKDCLFKNNFELSERKAMTNHGILKIKGVVEVQK